MEPSKPPRVFISYSWESEDHKSWVRHLAERLYATGIEARLDQWFVQPGESFTAFMEQEVAAADFALVICTPSYAHKSNKRQGGVGYEQQIVSGQLMVGTARSKFIPILRKGNYEQGPDCAIPTHFLGIACIEFRDDMAFEESLEDLIRVIFSNPRFAPPPLGARPFLETVTATRLNRIRLADADESIEKSDRVKTDLKEGGIEIKPDDPVASFLRGLRYCEEGDKDRAIAELSKVIEIKPGVALAYHLRGGAYADKGDMDRAIADYTKAIELKPDFAEAYHNRGVAYADNGDMDRAIADYSKAIALKPDYAYAYYNCGAAYLGKGDYDRAIAECNRAIALKPDYAEAYNIRGGAYSAKGDYDRGIAECNRVIEIKPDYAKAYHNRGVAYFAKGDNDRAITDYSRAIALKPDYADSYHYRGLAYADKGDYDRAIADYSKAMALDSNHANAYYNRGLAYFARREFGRAIADFRASLNLFTDPGDREIALEQLRRLGVE